MPKTKTIPNPAQTEQRSPTLGEYAHQVIGHHYRYLVKQEPKVIADKDPEYLHQMRVGSRRLRTALQVFELAVVLPEVASAKPIASVARVLGSLRDLDVQIATLQDRYYDQLGSKEQKALKSALETLQQKRRKALTNTQEHLARPRYQTLKTAFEHWLDEPCYTPLAQLPLVSLLPDLLSPLLSELLLHSGWLVATDNLSEENSGLLHELRKSCKHARYQAEFFVEFYDQNFQEWVKEIKELQEKLGVVQDGQVLLDLLQHELSSSRKQRWPELQAIVTQDRGDALADWEETRHKYLDPEFRQQLHQMMLKPLT